mmetsp:Transcript_89160/g.154384  ORF Transcript_89160/g.154384 Transcript_89160/m.154384 type:complete len:144 (+) Transcript_89160:48-479(+)
MQTMPHCTSLVCVLALLVAGSQAHVSSRQHALRAAAPAPAPDAAPAAGPAASDWRSEYGHAEDPSVLKWKTKGSEEKPSKLPEQGLEGKGVAHSNFKTVTADFGHEYGPKGSGVVRPSKSFCPQNIGRISLALASSVLVVAWL